MSGAPPLHRALVTGAAGFIGANLVQALEQAGVEVHALVRPSSSRWRLEAMRPAASIHQVDLADAPNVADVVAAIRPDVVFHAAASGVHHPRTAAERRATVTDTVLGTLNLGEAVAAAGISRLVCLGSSLEYRQSDGPIADDALLRPSTFRGASKAAATLLCAQLAAEAGVRAVILRLFAVYGPWETPTRFVPTVMAALRAGRELKLTRPGISRDFVFVGDVADACLRAASTTRGGTVEFFNIGSGVRTTNEALVELAQRVAGVRARKILDGYPERSVDSATNVADISKAWQLLGWAPAYSLEEGLLATWRWSARQTGEAGAWSGPAEPR
jgi:nucleoside-diphosphate-sugar epimerase